MTTTGFTLVNLEVIHIPYDSELLILDSLVCNIFITGIQVESNGFEVLQKSLVVEYVRLHYSIEGIQESDV